MDAISLKIGLCALLTITSLAANASVSWNFKESGSLSRTATGSYASTGSDTSTGGSVSATLTAWSAPVWGADQNKITNINSSLGRNNWGLVIDQPGDNSHTIDNYRNYEFVMFDFGAKELSLDAFNIGWDRTREGWADLTVMAYQGGTPTSQPAGDVEGVSLSGLSANGWSVISHHKDVVRNYGYGSAPVNSNLGSVYSSYWIIGAYMSAVGTGANTGDSITDTNWDGIKLAGISGDIRSALPPPDSISVPEPGTLLLTALGLAFIVRKKLAVKS